jgi:hypothetical protein
MRKWGAMWRCEDVEMWRCGDARMRRFEDEIMPAKPKAW